MSEPKPPLANRLEAVAIAEARARHDYGWLNSAIASHMERDVAHINACSICSSPGPGEGHFMQSVRDKRCEEGRQLHDEWDELAHGCSATVDGRVMRLVWPDGSVFELPFMRVIRRN